jgi:hypothetical protein
VSPRIHRSASSVEDALTVGEADEVALADRSAMGRAKAGLFLADLRLARLPTFPLRDPDVDFHSYAFVYRLRCRPSRSTLSTTASQAPLCATLGQPSTSLATASILSP